MEVGRSLDEIDQKVKKLNSSLSQSTQLTRELDKSIKLDPKNTEAVTNKMKSLQTQIGLATQKVALLKQKQAEANKAFADGNLAEKEFNKIEIAVVKAENELKKYNNELAQATNQGKIDGVSKLSRGFDKVESSLKRSQKTLRTFSALALGLVTTITGAITAFTNSATALNEQAKALDVNVEKLQLQRNAYKEITGDAQNYDSALSSLKGIMTDIALGNGNAYLNILKRLGVSTKDNEGNTKSLAEIYDEILVSLGEMENTTLRNSLAYELFGDNAINVLEVMQTSAETLTELNEQQMQLGIITEEQTETAEHVSEVWDNLKLQFMQVGAELAENLLPIIQAIGSFVTETILPILTTIANWFGSLSPQEQKFVAFLLLLIIFLPKVVAIITAIIGVVKAITVASYGAAGGIGAVSSASVPLIPIALAVVAVVMTLALLFAFLTGRSKELTSTLKSQTGQMEELENSYSNLEDNVDFNTSQVSENSNTNNVDIHVDIDAHGDTEMSQENAELVADLLAERINKELGGKI